MAYQHIETVKNLLGITGTYQDKTLDAYAQEVIAYMVDAGVEQTTAESAESVGVVARGISDLWNLGSGGASLSQYFRERVMQLAFKTKGSADNV